MNSIPARFAQWSRLGLAVAIFILLNGRPALAAGLPGAPVSQDKKMAWFNEARFGMFLHWGVYSVPAGEWNGQTRYGEWFQLETKMPAAQYAQFAGQFDPAQRTRRLAKFFESPSGLAYL